MSRRREQPDPSLQERAREHRFGREMEKQLKHDDLSPVFHDNGDEGRKWVAMQCVTTGCAIVGDVRDEPDGGYRVVIRERMKMKRDEKLPQTKAKIDAEVARQPADRNYEFINDADRAPNGTPLEQEIVDCSGSAVIGVCLAAVLLLAVIVMVVGWWIVKG